jgi:hypothetical protein
VGLWRTGWSLRLRLHSGLRQIGRAFGLAMLPKAEALGYLIVGGRYETDLKSSRAAGGFARGRWVVPRWKWAGAVGLCPRPTHAQRARMNGAPGFCGGEMRWVGLVKLYVAGWGNYARFLKYISPVFMRGLAIS